MEEFDEGSVSSWTADHNPGAAGHADGGDRAPTGAFSTALIPVATYLLGNALFRKLPDVTKALYERFRNMLWLNEMGRAVCSTFQTGEVMAPLAQHSMRVADKRDGVLVKVWKDEMSAFESSVFKKEGAPGMDREVADSLAERVVGKKEPVSTFPPGPIHAGVLVTSWEDGTLVPICGCGSRFTCTTKR